MVYRFVTGMDLFQSSADEVPCIDCGLCTLLCQLTDLVCHHGKASSGLSRSGCLDGSIQRQQVRLAGNVLDLADDVADLFGSLVDPSHDLHQVIHLGTAFVCLGRILLCLFAGILRMFCSIVYHGGNIADGGLQLLYGSCLIGSPFCQRLGGIRQTSGTHGHLVGYFIDIVQGFVHLIFNIPQSLFQFIQISHIEIGVAEFHRPVATCHGTQCLVDVLNDHPQIRSHSGSRPGHFCHFILGLYCRELRGQVSCSETVQPVCQCLQGTGNPLGNSFAGSLGSYQSQNDNQ